MEHVACDHVTIILPDIHPDDMQWLLDFMYTGSVAVPRNRLSSFLQAAETLHIKILTDMAEPHRTTDSRSVVSSPAPDFKLTNDPNVGKHLINSNIDPYNIKPYKLIEDCKNSSCNDDAKITSDSSRLMTNTEEFKTVTEDSKSCMCMCSLDFPSYAPKGIRSPIESNNVSCKGALNTLSLHDRVSRRVKIYEGTKGEDEEPSRMGAAVVISGSDTKISHNAEEKNNTSLGHPSETAITHLETPVHDKSPCDTRNVAGSLNSNHNPTISTGNHKSVNKPQEERGCNDTVATSVENFSSSEYGFKLNNNNNGVIPSSISPEHRRDVGVIDLPLRNQPENAEHCSLYSQRLPQWPKPLPSLMPISNNTMRYNGQLPACYLGKDCTINGAMTPIALPVHRKDMLPEHLQNMKDIIPNIEPRTSSMAAGQHFLKDHRLVRNVWFSGRDNVMHLNGQRPLSDCRPSRGLSHRVPRLCPIVPPSPWAQHHRPPCATPVACPPIAVNYPAVSWIVPPVHVAVNHGGGDQQPTPLVASPDHQQQLGDTGRPQSSTQAAKVVSNVALHTNLHIKTNGRRNVLNFMISFRKRTVWKQNLISSDDVSPCLFEINLSGSE
jgi:hypothetical protein